MDIVALFNTQRIVNSDRNERENNMYFNNQTNRALKSGKAILAKAFALATILSMGACATEYHPQRRGSFNANNAANAYLMFQQMQRNDTQYIPGAPSMYNQQPQQQCQRNPNGICWR